jgi:hypothetical protein
LLLGIRVRAVNYVDHQVGVGHLFQRGSERLDDVVRQVPDEPDGVGQRVNAPVGRPAAAGGRIEGREKRVFD